MFNFVLLPELNTRPLQFVIHCEHVTITAEVIQQA
jgi:hypothetical protein